MASESGGGTSGREGGCCEVEGDGRGRCKVGGVDGGTEPEGMGEKGRCWGSRCEGTVRDLVDMIERGVEEVARGWGDWRDLVAGLSLGMFGTSGGTGSTGDGCFRLSGTREGGSADWMTGGTLVRSTAIPTVLEVRDGPCGWATW